MKCRKTSFFGFLVGFLLILSACDDALELEVQDYESKLVVDGWIEQGAYPVVVLSKSAAYFSTIDSAALRELVASRAKVTVSDGEREEILTLKKNELYFPPYLYQATELKGEAGKTYQLTVELDGKKYEASTSIPPVVELDSLWFSLTAGKDSLGLMYARISDDPHSDNYYRIFTQRKNKDHKFIPIYLSAIGDQFFNGESFTFSLLRGSESLSDIQDDIYFRRGDTVQVKISSMDRGHFDFWRTLERELYVTGNPFSSSGNQVISNISGDALGVWGGYNPAVYQMVIE